MDSIFSLIQKIREKGDFSDFNPLPLTCKVKGDKTFIPVLPDYLVQVSHVLFSDWNFM